MATRLAAATATAMNDARVDRVDSGSGTAVVRIYSGSQPATGDTAASGTLLAEIDLPNPAFGASSSGSATAEGLPLSGVGLDDGTAGYYRVVNRNGDNVWDGSAGTSGTEMILNTATISTGVAVTITAWTPSQPVG